MNCACCKILNLTCTIIEFNIVKFSCVIILKSKKVILAEVEVEKALPYKAGWFCGSAVIVTL